MRVDVVLLPRELQPDQVENRAVVVFDVLRATTSIAAALAAGAQEIQVFDSLESARAAAGKSAQKVLLCGEYKCLAPPGFDLGNSPGTFTSAICKGRRLFLSTTNGTRALVAAREAPLLFTAALVNAGAVARRLAQQDRDVTLLCSGTNGQLAMDDIAGAGAMIHAMRRHVAVDLSDDTPRLAEKLFENQRDRLPEFLRECQSGHNILAAGLDEDIDFAAKFDTIDITPVCDGKTLIVRAG